MQSEEVSFQSAFSIGLHILKLSEYFVLFLPKVHILYSALKLRQTSCTMTDCN